MLVLWFTFPVSAQSACDTSKTVRCISVYPSGYKKLDYRFKQGARHGIWIEFNEGGKIITKTKYRRGVRIWEFRYVNNRVVESINRKGVLKKVKDCGC
jgi:antitoxin component YwqK of YwqJK toxin-antitoxin module